MSTRNPAHLADSTHLLSCTPGTNLAFEMALIVMDEGLYAEEQDEAALRAALTLWQRCSVDQRQQTLSTFWILAQRAAGDGDLNRSMKLSCCASILAAAHTYPLGAYLR